MKTVLTSVKFVISLVQLQVGASMNMAIGAAAPSTAVANLLGSLAVLLSILFGGFLLSRQQMPSVVSWMAQLSFVRSSALFNNGLLFCWCCVAEIVILLLIHVVFAGHFSCC